MIATWSCSRPMRHPSPCPFVWFGPGTSRGRDGSALLGPPDQIELLDNERLVRRLVAPGGLDNDEGHDRGVGLLLVDVEDLAFADEHVADQDRTVIGELLLAVEDERTLPEELPHHLVHRVHTLGGVGGLLLVPAAHVLHGERERGRPGDRREPGSLRRLRVAIDRVVVEDRRGEETHRPPFPAYPLRARPLPPHAPCPPPLRPPP